MVHIHTLSRSPSQDNEAWLTMEYVGGGSVSDILEVCGTTLSEAEARECTAWTVLALDYLHSNRKLHRVSKHNVHVTEKALWQHSGSRYRPRVV